MITGNLAIFLIGGGFIGVPIALHFMMQQKPKHLMFPALRFLQERRQTNQRKLKLRHFLLLFLRCLLLLLVALALAKPAVASGVFGAWLTLSGIGVSSLIVALLLIVVLVVSRPLNRLIAISLAVLLVGHLIAGGVVASRALSKGKDLPIHNRAAPVAAALLIDTSMTMAYEHQNQSRLKAAKEIGDWLLGEFPAESQVSVLETQQEAAFFSVDISAARKRMETLTIGYQSISIPRTIETAINLLQKSELEQKELYIFSDLSANAWSTTDSARLSALLSRNPDVSLYVIDLSVDQPQNLSLGELQLAKEAITKNGLLEVSGELISQGITGTRVVEFLVEKPDQRYPVRRDGTTKLPDQYWTRKTSLDFNANQRVPFRFELSGLETGIHHGVVRIVGSDGLPSDDQRSFAVEVRGQWQTLVIAPEDVNPGNITELLAPYAIRESGQALYACKEIVPQDLSRERLDDYSAIFLLDPKPISEAGWNSLHEYVSQGGGLFIMLGNNATASGGVGDVATGAADRTPHPSFNSENAQKLLPGLLTTVWEDRDNRRFISPQDFSHEIMAPFRQVRTSTPWADFPVRRHWGLRAAEQTDPDSLRVIVRYSNQMPALIERTIGQGRVLAMTTPFTDPLQPSSGRKAWNNFSSNECWPVPLLVLQGANYLVEDNQRRLNYQIGDAVVLDNDEEQYPRSYSLFSPILDDEPRRIQSADDLVRFRFTSTPGAYRLKGDRQGVVLRGFAVNSSSAATELTRMAPQQLNELLGDDRYQLAKTPDEIQREQGIMRQGQEFYPLICLFLLLMLGLEHLFANRFYGRRTSSPSVPSLARKSGSGA